MKGSHYLMAAPLRPGQPSSSFELNSAIIRREAAGAQHYEAQHCTQSSLVSWTLVSDVGIENFLKFPRSVELPREFHDG